MSTGDDWANRRQEERYALEAPALLVWGGERYRGTVRNLSSRGMFITLETRAQELRLEDRVEVALEELELTREATVCRVEEQADEAEPVGLGLILHESVDLAPVFERYL